MDMRGDRRLPGLARNGRPARSAVRSLTGVTRTWCGKPNSVAFDPGCVKTFFLPKKLHATGDDPHRHGGLSIFLLPRIWTQPGRNLGPPSETSAVTRSAKRHEL